MVPRIFCQGGQAVRIRKYWDQIDWGLFVQGNQILGDHLSMGTKFNGEHLSRGINFMGIVCPGGQDVQGSNGFGTKCVKAILIWH